MDFLEKLKKAVDSGEFNSDIANKINKINVLAEKKLNDHTVDELESKVNENNKKEKTTDDNIFKLNNEYEKKMEYFKKIDERNKIISELVLLNQKMNEINNRINVITNEYSNDSGIIEMIQKIKNGNFNDNEDIKL